MRVRPSESQGGGVRSGCTLGCGDGEGDGRGREMDGDGKDGAREEMEGKDRQDRDEWDREAGNGEEEKGKVKSGQFLLRLGISRTLALVVVNLRTQLSPESTRGWSEWVLQCSNGSQRWVREQQTIEAGFGSRLPDGCGGGPSMNWALSTGQVGKRCNARRVNDDGWVRR